MASSHRHIKDWLVATRPWSFPASVVPVLVTGCYLFFAHTTVPADVCPDTRFDMLNALLCLPLLVILHAGGNLVSDYFDHVNHVDKPGGPNGVSWIHDGTFRPEEILHYGWVLLAVGAALGLFILLRSGFEPVWVGALGIVLTLLYPLLKAHAAGDVVIFLCFALLPSLGMSDVVTGDYHPETMLYCLPYGLLTVSILHANNTRDIDNDRGAGLQTFPWLTGRRVARWVYVCELLLPYLLVAVFSFCNWESGRYYRYMPLVVLPSLPLALRNIHQMLGAKHDIETEIATLDKSTAQLQLTFGLLYALGFLVDPILTGLGFISGR